MSLLTFRDRGEWLVAGFNVDRLTDPAVLQRATRELVERLERLPLRGRAALTFEGVELASSQLVGLLLAARAIVVDDRFGRLALCRVGANLGEVLRLTKLEGQFERFARLRDLPADAATAAAATRPLARATVPGVTEWID